MSRSITPVVFLTLFVHFAFAGFHTHYFYYTVTNDWTSDTPAFTMTSSLDDVTLFWYDSDNEVIERRVPWFKSPNATLLDTSNSFYYQQLNMQRLLFNNFKYINPTKGYRILQKLEGCTLYDNGTVQVSFRYCYDGKPFMTFNVENARWTADSPEAEEMVIDSNSNTTVLIQNQQFLLHTCIPHITELLALGTCTFDRKKLSVIKVTWIPLDNGGVRLYCRAYGHYPKDIYIMWYKNGEQISEEILERATLPYPDLTYLTSLSFNVASTDGVYTCKVSHSSMTANYTQDLRISGDFDTLSSASSTLSIGAVIAICLAVILVIVTVVFGLVVVSKWRRH